MSPEFRNSYLLTTVSTAVLGVPRIAPPVGLLRVRFTVSSASSRESRVIGILKVRLLTPAPKVRLPEVAV